MKQHRNYSKEFRARAVRMVCEQREAQPEGRQVLATDEEFKRLQRENRELKRANEILHKTQDALFVNADCH